MGQMKEMRNQPLDFSPIDFRVGRKSGRKE